MARILDVALIVTCLAVYMGLSAYKLLLLWRYRNDPAKREALISTTQLWPKRLHRFLIDEDADRKLRRPPVSNSHSR
jgi:hypothetical protein